MIKLYGVAASRTGRALWMLEELGLEYEHIPTHFVGDAQKPDYLLLNPNGRIPTLDDDGLVVWESMAINLYLADKYDGGLKPASVADRAHAIQWSFWAMTEIEPGLLDALMHRMFLPEAERDAAVGDAGEEKLQRPLAVLDAELGRRRYVVGDAYSVADVNVASVLSWAAICSIDLAKYANLRRWLDACVGRPAAQKAMKLATG